MENQIFIIFTYHFKYYILLLRYTYKKKICYFQWKNLYFEWQYYLESSFHTYF